MIFDARGNPVRLVVLIAREQDVGFVLGAYAVDEPPADEDLDEALLRLYCHQMQIEEEVDVQRVQRKIQAGTIQAITAVLEPEEVLPFFEPVPGISRRRR